ncbi:MAG TPA: hypothetical protein VGT44_14580 [Ktedonobacteraceae bacterium]|nr:hypothetical protein [Ktedonobacteraceae bacterium]
MRGKLRDKRADARRDRMRRELVERRRSPKRENRTAAFLNRQLADEYVLEEEEEYAGAVVAGKK